MSRGATRLVAPAFLGTFAIVALGTSVIALGAEADGGAADAVSRAEGPDGGADAGNDRGTSGDGGGAAHADVKPDGEASFEPPRPLGGTDIPYPAGAPPHVQPIAVTVKLLVDTTGTVQKVELKTPPHPVFDEAVVTAAHRFHFLPARYAGTPVPVEITFTHRFLPPPPAPVPLARADEGPVRSSILRGKLVELGTRAPVSGATVTAIVEGRPYSIDADTRGSARLATFAKEAGRDENAA